MRRWLEVEREDPSFDEYPEGEYEVGFGFAGESDNGRSSEDPIEIATGRAHLRVLGRVDRLNWDAERTRYRVIDYKTGRVRDDHRSGTLRGGRALQLPLYLLAGAQLLDLDPESGSAEYHFSTRRGEFKRVGFDGEALRERREDLNRLLDGIATGVHSGVFLRRPKNERECEWCDFDPVCPSARFRQIERKAGDEHHQAFSALREIE